MTTERRPPDLNALLPPTRDPYPPEVSARRSKEQSKRAAKAQARAKNALARLHPEDYRSLYEQAKAQVAGERGPLPGDEMP